MLALIVSRLLLLIFEKGELDQHSYIPAFCDHYKSFLALSRQYLKNTLPVHRTASLLLILLRTVKDRISIKLPCSWDRYA